MVVTTNRKLRRELAPISNASVRCYAIRLQDGTLACIIKLTDNRLVYHTEPQTEKNNELECGPMPNLMVAQPNTGGALCSTPQSLADARY